MELINPITNEAPVSPNPVHTTPWNEDIITERSYQGQRSSEVTNEAPASPNPEHSTPWNEDIIAERSYQGQRSSEVTNEAPASPNPVHSTPWSEDVISETVNNTFHIFRQVIKVSPVEDQEHAANHEKCKHMVGVRWDDIIKMIINTHNAMCVEKTGVTFSPDKVKVQVQLDRSGTDVEMSATGADDQQLDTGGVEKEYTGGVETCVPVHIQQQVQDSGQGGVEKECADGVSLAYNEQVDTCVGIQQQVQDTGQDGVSSATEVHIAAQTSDNTVKFEYLSDVKTEDTSDVSKRNEHVSQLKEEDEEKNEEEEDENFAFRKEMKETLRQLRMRRNNPVAHDPDYHDEGAGDDDDDKDYEVDDDEEGEDDEMSSKQPRATKKSESEVELNKITIASDKPAVEEETQVWPQETMNQAEQVELEKPLKGYPAKCDVCSQRFKSRFKLNRHLKIHEPNHNQHPCKHCGKVCKTASNLTLHMAAHFKPKKPQGQKTSTQPKKQRPREKASLASKTCKTCGKTFKFPRNLRKHEKIHMKETNFPCEHCDKVCKSAHYLQLHMMVHAEEKQHKCPECDVSFGQKYQLKQHLTRVHEKHEEHKCNVCGVVYRDRYNLKDHMQEHTATKVYLCETCGKTFTRPNSYQLHLKYHEARANPNAFPCKLCPKSYYYEKLLNVHVRNVHMGERNFHCRVCGIGFFTKRQQFLHERVHQDTPSFVCPFCSKGFATKQTLQSHKRIHMGIRPFKCRYCDKAYTTKDFMSRHEKTHTSQTPPEKSFECKECNARFANRQALTDHEKRHRGIKDFRCDFCQTAFVTRGDLVRHLRMHTGGCPFKCNQCDKSFAKRRELTEHEAWHGTHEEQVALGTGGTDIHVHMAGDVPVTVEVPFQTQETSFNLSSL